MTIYVHIVVHSLFIVNVGQFAHGWWEPNGFTGWSSAIVSTNAEWGRLFIFKLD